MASFDDDDDDDSLGYVEQWFTTFGSCVPPVILSKATAQTQ
jgi:hypothetical protein